MFTDCQLVLFHGRQAEHVGVFSRVGFIKGFNVDGEFLHKGASEPAGEEEHPSALAGVAQWTEHRPLNQRVASSIPSQGTCLGCGPGPQ